LFNKPKNWKLFYEKHKSRRGRKGTLPYEIQAPMEINKVITKFCICLLGIGTAWEPEREPSPPPILESSHTSKRKSDISFLLSQKIYN